MARKQSTDVDVFLHLLRHGAVPAGRLSQALKQIGVPRSTYYYWRHRLASEEPSGMVRRLALETRLLAKQVMQLSQDLDIAKEALGKPWRRWPSGGSQSSGQ